MKEILGFEGEYRFLSNFSPSTVIWDGKEFPTVEHAYQSAKSCDEKEIEEIRTAPTPGKAKRLGQQVEIKKEDWENIKISIMTKLVRDKFNRHPDLRKALLATGDAYLEETNSWNDKFWGVCGGEGQNQLGKILTSIRSEIKENSHNG